MDEDDCTALSKGTWSSNSASSSNPPVGSFETCARCDKRLTVVSYAVIYFVRVEAETAIESIH